MTNNETTTTERKKSRNDRASGIQQVFVAGELYKIEVRRTGISVRRPRHKKETKSLSELVDWVIGQSRLPL